MMKKLVLHAREYAYPPINLPAEILEEYDVGVTDTLENSISFIKEHEGTEGFVLGVMMARQDVFPGYIDEAFKRKQELLSYAIKSLTECDGDTWAAYSLLFDKCSNNFKRAYDLLDGLGGIKLFTYLLKKEYVGKKPILFLTTQESKGSIVGRLGEIIIPPSQKSKIEILNMSADTSQIVGWFNRNIPGD